MNRSLALSLRVLLAPLPAFFASHAAADPTAVETPPTASPELPTAAKSDVDNLDAKIEKLRKKYGEGMHYEVDSELRILFVTGTDRRSLDEVKSRLAAHAAALQRDLFKHKSAGYLTVVVPKSWANKKVTGHFFPDFADASTTGSNLNHEFTHALHYADQVGRGEFQPVWIMEGFASMYEKSSVIDGHVVPLVNDRLARLQRQVADGDFMPFVKMTGLEHRQFTSHQYAQAQYMCMYLFASGKLNQWYASYTNNFSGDPTGLEAMEKVFGKPVGEIEKDWSAWLLKLDPPAPPPGPGGPSLAISAGQISDAVEISQVARNGAAEQAGLVAGDALISVGGARTIQIDDLVAALSRHKPGDSVKIEYRCDGGYRETTATLSAVPEPEVEKAAAP